MGKKRTTGSPGLGTKSKGVSKAGGESIARSTRSAGVRTQAAPASAKGKTNGVMKAQAQRKKNGILHTSKEDEMQRLMQYVHTAGYTLPPGFDVQGLDGTRRFIAPDGQILYSQSAVCCLSTFSAFWLLLLV